MWYRSVSITTGRRFSIVGREEDTPTTTDTTSAFLGKLGAQDSEGLGELFAEEIDWVVPGAPALPWVGKLRGSAAKTRFASSRATFLDVNAWRRPPATALPRQSYSRDQSPVTQLPLQSTF